MTFNTGSQVQAISESARPPIESLCPTGDEEVALTFGDAAGAGDGDTVNESENATVDERDDA